MGALGKARGRVRRGKEVGAHPCTALLACFMKEAISTTMGQSFTLNDLSTRQRRMMP